MSDELLINVIPGEIRAAAVANGALAELFVERRTRGTRMKPFFEKWRKTGVFEGRRNRAQPVESISPLSDERREIDPAIECINCGVCFAACDSVRWNAEYLGPAALNRAWTLQSDSRDTAHDFRLAALAGPGGCQFCHAQAGCSAHCPVGLDPSSSIAGLKRTSLRAFLKGDLSS